MIKVGSWVVRTEAFSNEHLVATPALVVEGIHGNRAMVRNPLDDSRSSICLDDLTEAEGIPMEELEVLDVIKECDTAIVLDYINSLRVKLGMKPLGFPYVHPHRARRGGKKKI